MPFNFGLLLPVFTPGLISTVSEVFCRRRELKDRPRLYLGVSRKAGLRRFTAAPENLSPLLSSEPYGSAAYYIIGSRLWQQFLTPLFYPGSVYKVFRAFPIEPAFLLIELCMLTESASN